MADPQLPRVQAAMLDGGGFASREWYDFFRDLVAVADQGTDQEAQILALQAAVAALEASGGNTATLLGPASIGITGTLAGGSVTFRLINDAASPGPTTYYGTDSAGVKGYHALTAGLAGAATVTIPAAAFQHSETVAAVGVTAASVVLVSLAPVTDDAANDPEMLDVVAMWATPGTDQITFGLTFSVPTVGPVKLNWSAI